MTWDELDPRNPDRIRDDIRDSLIDYARNGVPLGGFLQAVVSNQLVDAAARADADNLLALVAIACFVYNELPMQCWGSRRVYAAWIDWQLAKRVGPEEREAAAAEELETAWRTAQAERRSR